MKKIVNKTKRDLDIGSYHINPFGTIKINSYELTESLKQKIKSLSNLRFIDTFEYPDEEPVSYVEEPIIPIIQEPIQESVQELKELQEDNPISNVQTEPEVVEQVTKTTRKKKSTKNVGEQN